jgi:hypothetical protein
MLLLCDSSCSPFVSCGRETPVGGYSSITSCNARHEIINPLERRGLVRIEVGNVDQRERVAYLTAAGEAAIEAALPYLRKAQERTAALVQPAAIGELANQLDVAGAREQIPA